MASISLLNPKAEQAKSNQAMAVNLAGTKGLQEVLQTSLGPAGTTKMLVSGANEVKVTSLGKTLLQDMQIKHPTAAFIAKSASALHSSVGDGVVSLIILTAELLQQASKFLNEGIHPMILADGLDLAKEKCLEELEKFKVKVGITKTEGNPNYIQDGDQLSSLYGVCFTSLSTKLPRLKQVKNLTDIILGAVDCIYEPGAFFDLNMIEILSMEYQSEDETRLIRGLVLDHGSRHPDMPQSLTDVYILTCSVSLEYEKTEIFSGFFYQTAEMREKLVKSERDLITQRVQKIIDLKREVCGGTKKGFAVINTQGIDPISLDLLAREQIVGIRRAKRRNIERLYLATGAKPMNSLDDLTKECLGRADKLYEEVLGETKYTFIEGCPSSKSVTILVKGPNSYTIQQTKEAIYCGLRAVTNGLEDQAVLPGAGAFEIHAHGFLQEVAQKTQGRMKFGVQAFAEALLGIPRALYRNGGKDPLLIISQVTDSRGQPESPDQGIMGYDIVEGELVDPILAGIFENYSTKRLILENATVMAKNLLVVDEILRAGLPSL